MTILALAVQHPRADDDGGGDLARPPISTAADFVTATGINTHLAWGGPWARFALVEEAIAYLGITRLRDSVPAAPSTLAKYRHLAAKGVHFDVILTGPNVDIAADLAQIGDLERAAPGSVATIEGINEFNVNHAYLEGRDSFGDPSWGLRLDQALSRAVRADNRLAGVAVVAGSLANAGSADLQEQGDLSHVVDASNWHAYFSRGEQPKRKIGSAFGNARRTASGKPVVLTEAGYYTAIRAMDWGGGGVDEATQAKMTLNLLCDARRAGVAQTYLYALMDNVDHPADDDLEDSFGLFRGDGSPKAAAVALHNFTRILADPSAPAGFKASAGSSAVALSAVLEGRSALDGSLWLARADDTFDLVLWAEPLIWDGMRGRAIAADAHEVTLSLKQAADLSLFDPLASATAYQHAVASRTIVVTLRDHPVVIRIAPARLRR